MNSQPHIKPHNTVQFPNHKFSPTSHIEALLTDIEHEIEKLDEGEFSNKSERYKSLEFARQISVAVSDVLDMDYDNSDTDIRMYQYSNFISDITTIEVAA